VLLFLFTNSLANENSWSKDTPTLSDTKSKKIIQAYIDGNTTNIHFEDDTKNHITYNYRENILMFGFELARDFNSEKVYNLSGNKTEKFSSTNFKLLLGKDFTFWHDEYTQPSRLYASYSYNIINKDVTYTTSLFGLRENMFYWSIYKKNKLNLYPTFNLELGSSKITRSSFISSGFTLGTGTGLTLNMNDNFEYFININYKKTDWEHPIDGVADEMTSYCLSIGLNYKLMYGDI